MGGTSHTDPPGPLRALLLGWVVTVGLGVPPVAAYVHNTGDIRVLLAFLGSSFVLGFSLFIALGLAGMGARSRVGESEDHIADVRARGSVFGKR